MRIQYLPSCPRRTKDAMHLTTYLVNDTVAIDAGSIGYWESPRDQAEVTDIILTHSHLDHVGSLPMFLDNTSGLGAKPIRIHLSAATREALEQHVFREFTWASWSWLLDSQPPKIELCPFEAGQTIEVQGLRITAVAVDHSVPTIGVLIDDGATVVAISSDTGPSRGWWDRCREESRLSAVFLECSFPSREEPLAIQTGHLTPTFFQQERQRLGRPIRTIAMHLKPAYARDIADELAALDDPLIEIVSIGHDYEFNSP